MILLADGFTVVGGDDDATVIAEPDDDDAGELGQSDIDALLSGTEDSGGDAHPGAQPPGQRVLGNCCWYGNQYAPS